MSRSEGRIEAVLPMGSSSNVLVMENLPLETGKTSDPPEEGPVRKIHGFSWFLVMTSILSSILLYALDNTIVADLIPAIVNDFDSVNQVGWLSVGFVCGGVATIMPLSKLYSMFDAKWLYIASLVLFFAASALCGGAPTMTGEIVGRVLAGVGGIGIYIGVATLISVNTTEQERPAYLSLIGLIFGIGTVLGPVIGGVFEKVTWRWAFYINLIIGAVFTPVYLFLIPSFHPAPNTTLKDRAKQFDTIGAILSIGALILTIMAINFGGTLFAWNSAATITIFVIGILMVIAFGLQQSFNLLTSPSNRMFPVHFIRNKEAVLLFICTAACNSMAFIPIYYIPILFQFTRADSALESAVRLLPLIFLLSTAIIANGFFMAKFGYYMPWYAAGAALGLIANVLLSRVNMDTSTNYIYGLEALLGIGGGVFIQASYAVIQAVTDPADMSYGISFIMIAQIGGVAFSLAIASAVFVNGAIEGLQALLPDASFAEIQSAISGTSSALLKSLPQETQQKALGIVVGNLSKVFIPAYVGSAIALVGAVFLSRKRVFLKAAAGA